MFGYRLVGWIKLEVGGKVIGKLEKGVVGVLKNVFKEYYIFLNLKEFIYIFYFIDLKW